ncbi:MAG: hypothetical protein Q7K57_56655 [Burkholderiaceae bacterium]|nr:hypothetical protein [Burkholderiaceae bacterium]
MNANDLLKRWKQPLSQRIGRSEKVILEDGLLTTDFPDSSVHIVFEDGSDLTFRRAFYLGGIAKHTVDESIYRVAVFSEHVGYHEFWVGPEDRIDVVMQQKETLADLLKKCDPNAPLSDEDRAWDNMPPVGREFGSPDYERLMEQDRTEFQSNLAGLIKVCSDLVAESRAGDIEADERQDAVNVQIALQELGQHVSLGVAAEVWRCYSQSLMAGWMSGAETIASAKKTLFFYVGERPSRSA